MFAPVSQYLIFVTRAPYESLDGKVGCDYTVSVACIRARSPRTLRVAVLLTRQYDRLGLLLRLRPRRGSKFRSRNREREREGERVRAAALLKRKKEMRHNYTVTTTAVNGRKHEEADVSLLVCFSCIAAFQ